MKAAIVISRAVFEASTLAKRTIEVAPDFMKDMKEINKGRE